MFSLLFPRLGHSPEGAFDAGVGQRVIVAAGFVKQLLCQCGVFAILCKGDIDRPHEPGPAKSLQVPGETIICRTMPAFCNLVKGRNRRFRIADFRLEPAGNDSFHQQPRR